MRYPRAKKPATEGVFEFLRPTVADALAINPNDPPPVSPYRIGSEATSRAQRGRCTSPGHYSKAADVDALLEDHKADAEAGVPDEWLGRRVGLSKDQVSRWRRRHGIGRSAGRKIRQLPLEVLAVDVFGRNPMPRVVPTNSPVDGQWEPPRYVLREPLDYTRFAELVYDLVSIGHSPARVAAGLGVRPTDVDAACRLWAARKRGAQ